MTVGVGVVGLGFMGRTHLDAYSSSIAAGLDATLVAVADRSAPLDGSRPAVKGNLESETDEPLFDSSLVETSRDPAAVFRNPEVQLVSICTHTKSHVELALAALAAGKHVLLEKPIALTVEEVERLRDAESNASTWIMPAMCMRFWPGWSWLKSAIDGGSFGAVRSAAFRRLAFPPDWSPKFYANSSENGGALFDLHVHDADLVNWLFGEPASVHVTGSLDHLTASYTFAKGPSHVIAEGGWDHTPGYAFRMSYTVVFEHATAEFELGHAPTWTLARDGERETLELPAETGYDLEVRHALECAASGARPSPSLDEALAVTRQLVNARRDLTHA